MMIQEEKMLGIRYDVGTPEFMILSGEAGAPASAPWIVRDGSGSHGRDPMDIEAYFHELCAIFIRQINEFETLPRKADKQEQKKLQTTLALALEAQELLYDEDD